MEEKRGNAGAAWIVVALLIALLLPVLYVLSVGPVVAMVQPNSNEPAWFATVYAPLIWLDQNSTAASSFFEWYVGFWVSPPTR
jgi:hypothetical protein